MTNAFDCSIKSRQLLIAICGCRVKCGRNACSFVCLSPCLCVENILSLNFKPSGDGVLRGGFQSGAATLLLLISAAGFYEFRSVYVS